MAGEWDEIEKLRKAAHAALPPADRRDPAVTRTIEDDARIRQLLDRLAAAGDLEAEIQRSLDAISRLYYEGDIHRCEAFARAMQSFAQHVARHSTGDFDAQEYLSVAWGYLCSDGFQDFFPDAASIVLRHRRSHGYDLVAPDGHWSNEHSAAEGVVGSGWMQPVDEDLKNPLRVMGGMGAVVTVEDQARSGKQDHFLANAVANYYAQATAPTSLGGTLTWVHMQGQEDSKTDQKMNSLGHDFGAFVRGGFIPPDPQMSPDRIADWIRENLCTEVFKRTLYFQSRDQVNYPNNERASYHYYEFKIASPWSAKKDITWKAWVRVDGSHSHTAWSGMREVELKLSKCHTSDDLKNEAQKASALDFKTPPGR